MWGITYRSIVGVISLTPLIKIIMLFLLIVKANDYLDCWK
jgi:hypothetical protein